MICYYSNHPLIMWFRLAILHDCVGSFENLHYLTLLISGQSE
jgi:hypothetical protein